MAHRTTPWSRPMIPVGAEQVSPTLWRPVCLQHRLPKCTSKMFLKAPGPVTAPAATEPHENPDRELFIGLCSCPSSLLGSAAKRSWAGPFLASMIWFSTGAGAQQSCSVSEVSANIGVAAAAGALISGPVSCSGNSRFIFTPLGRLTADMPFPLLLLPCSPFLYCTLTWGPGRAFSWHLDLLIHPWSLWHLSIICH